MTRRLVLLGDMHRMKAADKDETLALWLRN
jgi:hypothetical protein